MSELPTIVDWFYGEPPTRGSSSQGRGEFLQEVGKDPKSKPLVAAIIRDERFASLNWGALHELIRIMNAWSEKPIISDQEEDDAWHPLGIGHFDTSVAEAEKKWPNETRMLRQKLDEWRARLRESVPSLLDAQPRAR